MQGYNYANLSALGTTTIKSGAGVLHSVTINTPGLSSDTATLYDNTAGSGTKIATIAFTSSGVTTLLYDIVFRTGLTVVLATGTSADLTVLYL